MLVSHCNYPATEQPLTLIECGLDLGPNVNEALSIDRLDWFNKSSHGLRSGAQKPDQKHVLVVLKPGVVVRLLQPASPCRSSFQRLLEGAATCKQSHWVTKQ